MPVFDYFSVHPLAFYFFIAVLGLFVGSFLNVVIYRLPLMLMREWQVEATSYLTIQAQTDAKTLQCPCCHQAIAQPTLDTKPLNLCQPRSECPHCHQPIKPWHNIPLFSYLWLKGRCSGCQQKISWRYPLVEGITALLSVLLAKHFGYGYPLIAALVLTWALIALATIDLQQQILPDNITLPLLWLGLLVNTQTLFTSLDNALWGAVIGYLSLWLIFWVFKWLTGKEGLGYGDFKLLAALGAWLGWQMLPLIILFSSLLGSLIGITLIVAKGRSKELPIPLGPILCIA